MEIINILKNIDWPSLDCDYADARVEDTVETFINFEDGQVLTSSATPTLGAFLRVRRGGQWFEVTITDIGNIPAELTALALRAKKMKPNRMAFGSKDHGQHKHRRNNDLRATPITDKQALTKKAFESVQGVKALQRARVVYKDMSKVKYFANSAGTVIEHDYCQAGLMVLMVFKDGDKLFEDKYGSFGWSFGELTQAAAGTKAYAEEAFEFLHAKAIDAGTYRVVMDAEVVGVFTHESFGHKSEADFMLGDPEALKQWEIGKQVASKILNIVDWGSHERTSGEVLFDDEGTPAKKNYLIKDGKLAGRLHSLETSQELKESATGNGRAKNFEYPPIVRMTSTYIEAGTSTKEELLTAAGNGVFVSGMKYGSGLSTFTIAPIRAWMIRDGKMAEPVRIAMISGSVFETLFQIEMVSKDFELHSGAIGGCGKNDQMPLPVADGGPLVLVNGLQVS